MEEHPTSSTVEVEQAKARPLTGGLLGVIIGLAIAVLLQQHGIWPLDRVGVFLVPAIIGLLGVGLTRLGRIGAPGAMSVALVGLLAMGAWGATGLFEDARGQLNGGCTVDAQSSVDTTTVVDTSRSSPFRVDPDGSLSWQASSPTAFRDYEWQVWVEVGGFPIQIAGGTEANDEGSTENNGTVSDVREALEDRGVLATQLRGVFKVGGHAATCDGFGFVYLVSSPFGTVASIAAAAVGAIALLILGLVAFTGRNRPVTVESLSATPDDLPPEFGGRAEVGGSGAPWGAAAGGAGAASEGWTDPGEHGDGEDDRDRRPD